MTSDKKEMIHNIKTANPFFESEASIRYVKTIAAYQKSYECIRCRKSLLSLSLESLVFQIPIQK